MNELDASLRLSTYYLYSRATNTGVILRTCVDGRQCTLSEHNAREYKKCLLSLTAENVNKLVCLKD